MSNLKRWVNKYESDTIQKPDAKMEKYLNAIEDMYMMQADFDLMLGDFSQRDQDQVQSKQIFI